MEAVVGGGGGAARARRSRETSPDRARACLQPKARPFRKVQVVYYLCRNGQLEQPHFMEVAHVPTQHLRLKDVMDRLTVLRGRGMPSLFSWSCKRSYKNGYVWNDLAENDAIYPADGSEYILKGSEIVEGCSERFQQLQLVSHKSSKLPLLGKQPPRHFHLEEPGDDLDDPEDDDPEAEEAEADEDKAPWRRGRRNTRCSRGVSTDEMAIACNAAAGRGHHTELVLDEDASPPSSSSSEKAHPPATAARGTNPGGAGGGSTRFDDADAAEEPGQQSRGSILLQLIACGSAAGAKARGAPPKSAAMAAVTLASTPNTSGRKSAGSLHRGVLCRAAAATAVAEEDGDEINCMSENPRFGNLQREDKEYFSGSIVESMTESRAAAATSGPCLKKSSSYNEERSSKCGLGEAFEARGEEAQERSVKAKCIPGRKRSAPCIGSKPQQQCK